MSIRKEYPPPMEYEVVCRTSDCEVRDVYETAEEAELHARKARIELQDDEQACVYVQQRLRA